MQYALSNGYYIAFETLKQGQTPGKRFANIRVVRDSGQPVGLKESSLRSLIGPIDLVVFLIGAVLITFTASEKRLGDLLAGTLVIQDQQQGSRSASRPLNLSEYSARLALTLISEVNLKVLTADQFLTLRDYLGYRSQLTPSMQTQVTTKLATQLRRVLHSDKGASALDIDDLALLEATYIACQKTHYA
ncbi:MAG: RDD family protein [Acaryochloridaceae cyanobacterium SU_2_1]|nr:RDD family protein [Acaryochloridaceae cyanobacterium SU_2_1]